MRGRLPCVSYEPLRIRLRNSAARPWYTLAETFPDAKLGCWHDELVGPHVRMFRIFFPHKMLASFLPWLMLNRNGLTVLLHPDNRRCLRRPHRLLRDVLPLKLDILGTANQGELASLAGATSVTRVRDERAVLDPRRELLQNLT